MSTAMAVFFALRIDHQANLLALVVSPEDNEVWIGMGTILGPTVGAFIVVTLQNQLAFLEGWVTVITGVIFVICVLLFRRGVVGEIAARIKK